MLTSNGCCSISVPLIWAIATNSSVLSSDPILWFAMMVMPVGPPAMRILALADVSHMGEAVKMSIARFLTVSPLHLAQLRILNLF